MYTQLGVSPSKKLLSLKIFQCVSFESCQERDQRLRVDAIQLPLPLFISTVVISLFISSQGFIQKWVWAIKKMGNHNGSGCVQASFARL